MVSLPSPEESYNQLTFRQYLICEQLARNPHKNCFHLEDFMLRFIRLDPRNKGEPALSEMLAFANEGLALEALHLKHDLEGLAHFGVRLINVKWKLFDGNLPINIPNTFGVEVNQTTLKQSLANCLKAFREDKFSFNKGKLFHYLTSRKIVLTIIKEFTKATGNEIHYSFDHQAGVEIFKQKFPSEYEIWQSGGYELLVFPTLSCLEKEGKVRVNGFTVKTDEVGNPILVGSISLRSKQKQIITTPNGKVIRHIELENALHNRLVVYLNQDYKYPFSFKKNTKIGKLLYTIAHKGHASFQAYSKEFYRINDQRFRFFAPTTPFAHQEILIREGNRNILPHPNVSITFINQSNSL